MPDRRGSRFALEVLFLVALAVGLAIAKERPLVIAGVMALGWLLMALAEWAAWRGRPHYGSGLPPRYYIPQVSLPPRQPLEQFGDGYPAGRDEAPTWIASPALRAEVLGGWPVPPPTPGEATEEAEAEVDGDDDRNLAPAAALVERQPEPEPQPQAVAVADEEPREEDEPEPEEPVEQERVEEEPAPDARPQAVAVAEEEPGEEDEPEPEEPVGPPRRRRLWGRRGDDDDGADPWAVAELPPAGEGAALALPVATETRTARHRIDPLDEPERKRWPWQRSPAADGAYAEVPARPEGPRALPGTAGRED